MSTYLYGTLHQERFRGLVDDICDVFSFSLLGHNAAITGMPVDPDGIPTTITTTISSVSDTTTTALLEEIPTPTSPRMSAMERMSFASSGAGAIHSSASTPSLRSRDGTLPPHLRMDNGGNVRVVVRVRAFLPRGMSYHGYLSQTCMVTFGDVIAFFLFAIVHGVRNR